MFRHVRVPCSTQNLDLTKTADGRKGCDCGLRLTKTSAKINGRTNFVLPLIFYKYYLFYFKYNYKF